MITRTSDHENLYYYLNEENPPPTNSKLTTYLLLNNCVVIALVKRSVGIRRYLPHVCTVALAQMQ